MTALAVAAALIALVAMLGTASVRGRRSAGTAGDLVVASRGVTPWWNASAISGESISAAAFLGTAGLVLAYGADMLWLPIAATAGYVLLLAFVTAPLRRSGAYSVSDFAEWRLGSRTVRRIVTGCVCFIGWFYLLPQFKGAGVTLRVLTGAPVWTGWAVVAAVALLLATTGGIRGITAVQAVQFWVKLAAVAVPAVVLLAVWNIAGAPDPVGDAPPNFERATRVQVRTDAAVTVPAAVTVTARGRVDGAVRTGETVPLAPGRHTLGSGTVVRFPAGAPVPHAARLPVQDGITWATPFGRGQERGLFRTYSALLAVLLGTMGLPHILMRFYTSTSGAAARRTAAFVPVLLALFSVFPALHGTLGRLYAPELLMTGDTDATLLMLPQRMIPGPGGALLTGLVTAGAFAAFIATSCGIVVAFAGTVSQCVRRGDGVTTFRLGVVLALAVPLAVLPSIGPQGAVGLVTMALCVSACTLCPLLVLGIWWRGLTAAGAAAGLLVGGGVAVAAGIARLFAGPCAGWPNAVLAQPAAVLAPTVFAVMVAVSLLTRRRVPRRADRALRKLHLPEGTPVR
ncbi:cation acetate symporter [Actinomadura sp. KC216]|uniref:sodium:solute symporter family transporter n=1 Tax=Actinomadura sp. KC216 TaxID=2530370 RepID=UPI001052E9D4|nr:cation acetate symporter [Actinomadura sp. KC216]TDB84157.1 cation acetate symporter [Actinomadura sp. KC216]